VFSCRTAALQQVSQLPPAPSVGMHDVPYESVGQHLGLLDDEDDDDDDEDDEEEGDKKKRVRDKLDDRLARQYCKPTFFSRTDPADRTREVSVRPTSLRLDGRIRPRLAARGLGLGR
jgi:hypothetical protein